MAQAILEKDMPKEVLNRLNNLENEILGLKHLIYGKMHKKIKRKSLEGMGKLLVSEEELEKSIEEAKKSLVKGI
jgi:hypothetical protein